MLKLRAAGVAKACFISWYSRFLLEIRNLGYCSPLFSLEILVKLLFFWAVLGKASFFRILGTCFGGGVLLRKLNFVSSQSG